MKTIGHILFFFVIIFKSFSQGLIINNTASFVLTDNSNLIIRTVGISESGIYNVGTRTFHANSNVKFSGNVEQFIGGTHTITFGNVHVLNTSVGGLYLRTNTNIFGNLYLTNGRFNLRDNICELGYTGNVVSETDPTAIIATNSLWQIGQGTGQIRAIRDNPSGNVAGLGLNFTPSSPLGNGTIIRRACHALQGTGSYTSNYSIYRYYQIIPTNPMPTLTINNFYYWGGITQHELNGHPENGLIMFQRVQFGGGSNPIYWEPRNTTWGGGGANNYVTSSTRNDISLNYIEITLGSDVKPLPVNIISFLSRCNQLQNILTWQTASETNNAGFDVQKSHNGTDWETMGFVQGQGNSNTTTTYTFTDDAPYYPITYYRLRQIDHDGNDTYSQVIAANCSSPHAVEEDVNVYFTGDHLQVQIIGKANTTIRFYVTNVLGQVICNKKLYLSEPIQQFTIDKPLAAGMYYVNLIGENFLISKPVQKQ
ncbi:MAG: hypothetical protein N2449_01030 [Bacteroidales bacterium]|nr:hypothetical protein [Bacteroidales bacterium]